MTLESMRSWQIRGFRSWIWKGQEKGDIYICGLNSRGHGGVIYRETARGGPNSMEKT